jgi:stage III sporulation protein AA
MHPALNAILPERLRSILSRLDEAICAGLEELRVREGKPLEVNYDGRYAFVTPRGGLTMTPSESYKPDKEDCAKLLDIITNHSLYSFEEELRRGYITVRGGHRVGLAGRAVLDGGRVKLLRDISGFNIRLAREMRGVADKVVRLLIDQAAGSIHHTLVISPPQCGKTTLIRDLARILSEGSWGTAPGSAKGARGLKVGIVDERSEIAACVSGMPTFDVGPRTDVLDACPKAEGMMMMIRSLSPEVMIVDEIGRKEDADAIQEAMHAGIRIVATAHGRDVADVKRRPDLAPLFAASVFRRYVVLRGAEAGRAQLVYDQEERPLQTPHGKAVAAR